MCGLACIEEPYTYKGKLQGIPTDARIVLADDENPMVAIVLYNKQPHIRSRVRAGTNIDITMVRGS